MTAIADAAEEFLGKKRIAVTGVSRNPQGHGSNGIYLRLKERGYDVFAINPNASELEGDVAYPDLASVPGGVEAVVIGTRPEHALATVKEAVKVGASAVWMHGGFGKASVDADAAAFGREKGLTVIDGACPLMFGKASDGFHRFMCGVQKLTGQVPREV